MKSAEENLDFQRKYNLARSYDRLEVEVSVSDSGLKAKYCGILYFGTGDSRTCMVGLDEIMIECIESIRLFGIRRTHAEVLSQSDGQG